MAYKTKWKMLVSSCAIAFCPTKHQASLSPCALGLGKTALPPGLRVSPGGPAPWQPQPRPTICAVVAQEGNVHSGTTSWSCWDLDLAGRISVGGKRASKLGGLRLHVPLCSPSTLSWGLTHQANSSRGSGESRCESGLEIGPSDLSEGHQVERMLAGLGAVNDLEALLF